MLCVLILYISVGTYSLKSITNDRFFEELFHGNFLSNFLSEICWEAVVEEIFFSYFLLLLMSDLRSNKPTHYLPDNGDFRKIVSISESARDTADIAAY